MHLHGFEPQEGNIKSFATFCERLESLLDEPALKKQGSSTNKTNKKTTDNDSSNGKKKRCCGTDGAACPSIRWSYLSDEVRGPVLEIMHEPSASYAALFTESSAAIDLSDYQSGYFVLDLRHMDGPNDYRVKLDCFYPCE